MDELKVSLLGPSSSVTANVREIFCNGTTIPSKFPPNSIKNTKYNVLSIVPLVIYNQFKYFFNFFYLLITVAQLYPPFQVGFLITYIGPLAFVLTITILKEAYDDLTRWRRDKTVNSQVFTRITNSGHSSIAASDIEVGHLIEIKAGERIPADMVLLSTSEESGSIFIRTDQLDGETDWKLRRAVASTQKMITEGLNVEVFASDRLELVAEEPSKNIYKFSGTFLVTFDGVVLSEPLDLEHTLWSSTILTKGTAVGVVVYTGKETRVAMNSNQAQAKFGICDEELNFLSKLMFILMILISLVLVVGTGFSGSSHILFFRHLLLLSSIIPISLRVNLDLAKIWYCRLIQGDKKIPNTVARNSGIPEELGRIDFLLTDKTGTLTCNEMSLKKSIIIDEEIDDLKSKEKMDFIKNVTSLETILETSKKENIKSFIKALAICHNVTPIKDDTGKGEISYQASSPDEIAFVKYADIHGIELNCRTENSLWLKLRKGDIEKYVVLDIFPFSSSTKRMGIIIQHPKSGRIYFYVKGAEDVMKDKIDSSFQQKFVEDCEKLAREGLRTLIFAYKELSEKQYRDWKKKFDLVSIVIDDRERKIREVIDQLEFNLMFLGVTGVEDKLQKDVGKTIKDLRSAGITVWILTGDKVETAQCIATTTELKTRTEDWFEILNLKQEDCESKLAELARRNLHRTVIVIDGSSLARIFAGYSQRFLHFLVQAPAVICSRVAPTQKTQIVELLKSSTQKRICSIGDGGNDVGMIQAAHVGIGIEGKEGKQASLAADFSIEEFSALRSLILCHGRHSYKRTAKMSNFVFHRGVIISVIQALFSCMFYFNAIPIYNGILMMGYATFYTNMPVFSIVLDQDATLSTLMVFPQLYLSLRRSKAISFKSFCICIFKSAYQGSAIIIAGVLLFPENNFTNIVSITFTALIFTELLNVMTEIDRFHWAMGISQVITGIIYLLSMFALKSYFDLGYLFSIEFIGRVIAITLISWMPLHLIKVLMTLIDPADYRKVETS